jgi:hypothetical protein
MNYLAAIEECDQQIRTILERKKTLQQQLAADQSAEAIILKRFQQGDYIVAINGRHWWANEADTRTLLDRCTAEDHDALDRLQKKKIIIKETKTTSLL